MQSIYRDAWKVIKANAPLHLELITAPRILIFHSKIKAKSGFTVATHVTGWIILWVCRLIQLDDQVRIETKRCSFRGFMYMTHLGGLSRTLGKYAA